MIDEVILYRLKYIYNQINVVQKGWIPYYHDKLVSVQYQLSIIRKLYLIWVYILVIFGNYGFYFSCKNKCSLFEYNYELYVSYNYIITLLLYRFLNLNFIISPYQKKNCILNVEFYLNLCLHNIIKYFKENFWKLNYYSINCMK